MKRNAMFALLFCLVSALPALAADEGDWIVLFDGSSMDNWKASENSDSWKLEDGKLVCNGPRSHLFYMGKEKPFKNFELKLDIMTMPKSNSGVYFHTKYQETGWPKHGFEAQVNNTHGDPKKTASVYAVKNVTEAPAKDNEWFTMTIRVEGNKVTTSVDGKTQIEYVEPEGTKPGKDFTRKLDEGTFALQAHDPVSKVYYKNIRVRRLP